MCIRDSAPRARAEQQPAQRRVLRLLPPRQQQQPAARLGAARERGIQVHPPYLHRELPPVPGRRGQLLGAELHRALGQLPGRRHQPALLRAQ
eukprot:4104043-Lingulodinium_polyedra.AAC.1